MKIDEIEILIWSAEIGLTTIENSFYCELVAILKKSKRKDLLDRLLAIKPYEKKGETDG